jgi:anti-sigma B factor antagonist
MMGSDDHRPRVAATEEDAGERRLLLVSIAGELDLGVSEELSAELNRAKLAEFGGDGIVLDLSGVTFMDSSGVQALLVATEAMRGAGRSYGVVVPGDSPINAILELTQIAQRLPLYRDIGSARNAVGASR